MRAELSICPQQALLLVEPCLIANWESCTRVAVMSLILGRGRARVSHFSIGARINARDGDKFAKLSV